VKRLRSYSEPSELSGSHYKNVTNLHTRSLYSESRASPVEGSNLLKKDSSVSRRPRSDLLLGRSEYM
jgi:hypothetical protein